MDEPFVVDAQRLACPLPIVKLALALTGAPAGAVVRLLATDPGAEADLSAWCEATGHRLLAVGHEGALLWADVQKARP